MNLKQPKFWYSKKVTFLSKILYPISLIYSFLFFINRKFSKEFEVSIPIICIGNLVMGGSGKTPTVIALRKILAKNFKKIFVLSRGYGGKSNVSREVLENDSYREIGDEAIIHKKYGPVFVSKNKIYGCKMCLKNEADLVILDDGFQSKNIKKNLSILIVDKNQMFGNNKVFPSGPLRENIKTGTSRADIIITTDNNDSYLRKIISKKIPIFLAKKIIEINNLKKREVLAFCGIGYPDNFFYELERKKIIIKRKMVFSDHYAYSENDIENILLTAKQENLEILTTVKDLVKINKKYWSKIKVVNLSFKILQAKKLNQLILKKLNLEKFQGQQVSFQGISPSASEDQ